MKYTCMLHLFASTKRRVREQLNSRSQCHSCLPRVPRHFDLEEPIILSCAEIASMVPFESIADHLGGLALFEIPFRMLSGRGWAGQAYAAIDQGTNAADVGAIVFGIGVSGALREINKSAWAWSDREEAGSNVASIDHLTWHGAKNGVAGPSGTFACGFMQTGPSVPESVFFAR